MGFTRYFEYAPTAITDETWQSFCTDVRKILDTVERGDIPLGNGLGEGRPVVNDRTVIFNGAGDGQYESLHITRDAPDPSDQFFYRRYKELGDRVWDFCKTERKPYDVAVAAVLLRAATVLPDFTVRSDGHPEDWGDGALAYARVFGTMPDVSVTVAT